MCDRRFLKGEKGKRGHRGPTGPQGLQGNVGKLGPTGPRGLQGLQGNVGMLGPTGPQGVVGILGPTGAQGNVGVPGPTGAQGNVGLQGVQGEKGDTGPIGMTGPPGANNNAGGNLAHENMQPYLAVNFIINVDGSFPNPNVTSSTPYLGEIRLMAGSIIPKGWMVCDGTILLKDDYFLLFGVIGNMFGGDAITTFALPDFRSRVPIHISENFSIGQSGGSEKVILDVSQLAIHNHA